MHHQAENNTMKKWCSRHSDRVHQIQRLPSAIRRRKKQKRNREFGTAKEPSKKSAPRDSEGVVLSKGLKPPSMETEIATTHIQILKGRLMPWLSGMVRWMVMARQSQRWMAMGLLMQLQRLHRNTRHSKAGKQRGWGDGCQSQHATQDRHRLTSRMQQCLP